MDLFYLIPVSTPNAFWRKKKRLINYLESNPPVSCASSHSLLMTVMGVTAPLLSPMDCKSRGGSPSVNTTVIIAGVNLQSELGSPAFT